MADYWVSRDKYFCKYCKIYIADDKPSRLHHETGLRHKGNYERYIRDVYKKGMQDKRDRADEAKELARVEIAAAAAMGRAPPPAAPSASSSKPKPTAAGGAADPYANYSTAEQLGFKDEAAEKAAKEAEVRLMEGRIGEWERVVKPVPGAGAAAGGEVKGKGKSRAGADEGFVGAAVLGRGAVKREDGAAVKREYNAVDEKPPLPAPVSAATAPESDDDEATNPIAAAKKRGFLAEKAAFADDDEDGFAASLGPIKVKRRRLTVKEQQAEDAAQAEAEAAALAARAQKEEEERARKDAIRSRGAWESVEVEAEPMIDFGPPPLPEDAPQDEASEEAKVVVAEEKPQVAAGGGFKKRKIPGAAARRK